MIHRKKESKEAKRQNTQSKSGREAEGERFRGPEKHRARFPGPWERQGEVSSPGVSAATGRASREREGEDGSSAKRGGSFSLVWLWRRMQQQLWRIAGEAVAYVWSFLSSNLFSFLFLMRACLCGMCTDFTETVLLLCTGS
jgi:hypothetical protein